MSIATAARETSSSPSVMSSPTNDSRSPRREYTTIPSTVPRAASGMIRTDRDRCPRYARNRSFGMPAESSGSSQDGTSAARPEVIASA